MALPTTDITNQGNPPGSGPYRPGGQPPSGPIGSTSRDAEMPSTPSSLVKKQHDALVLVRDLVGGPEVVRSKKTTYLPQAPGEDPQNYASRLARSVFFNVFGHTIKGLVGQVFRRDPVLGDDVPPIIEQHCENIDLSGTHFDVFARDLEQDALTAGHCAVLVEFPQTEGKQNAAQERSEIRPYWVPIRKDDIVSFRTVTENGKIVLTQLVLKECTMIADGAFGEREQTLYRVLYRENGIVGFRLLQENKDKTVTVVDEGLYPTQVEIPVAEIITSGRKGIFESAPPLIDLAYLNVAHYQQYSDYTTSIHKTCVPIFVMIGVDQEGALTLGANSALALPIGGDAKYVAHDGAALNECKQSLDDLKSDMGTLGLAMLSPQKRSAETAQAKKIDKASEDSALATTARGLQDGLERALGFHARYLRLDSGGSVSVNREFDEQTMQADMLTAWTGAVSNAGIPAKYMVTDMQAGGLIPPDEDVDDIVGEMEAAQEAKQQAADQAAQDKATMAQSGNKKGGPVDIHYDANNRPIKLVPSKAGA